MHAIVDALKILVIMAARFGVLFLVAIVNGRAFRREQATQKLREQKQEAAAETFPKG